MARHAMVTKVRGAFNEFEGTATLDGANPADSSAQRDDQRREHRHQERPA